MRFLATGDLQVHKWSQFAYTNKRGMNSRLANCLSVLSFLRKTAVERGVKRILLNGDVLEKVDYIDVEVFDGLYTELEKSKAAGLDTTINLGNHDVFSESSGRVLHALRALRGVATIVEEPTLVWDCVQVVPWNSSVDHFKETIRSLKASRRYCLALHIGVQGAVTGPKAYLVRNPIKLADIRHKEFGLTILSDYHTRQRLAKDPDAWYLGSPLQHSFGEVHKPCVWEVRVDTGGSNWSLDKIYTDFPRFRRVSARSYRELLRLTAEYEGDYVQVSSRSDSLSDDDIRRAASVNRFQVNITRSREDGLEEIQDSKSLSFKKAMKRYVAASTEGKKSSKRLLKLGWKIFNGEI